MCSRGEIFSITVEMHIPSAEALPLQSSKYFIILGKLCRRGRFAIYLCCVDLKTKLSYAMQYS